MNRFLDTLPESGGRSIDAFGSALGSITDGLSCAVGDAGQSNELPSEIRDDLEKFGNINPGNLTGEKDELRGLIADAGGFPDPSEFFNNIDSSLLPSGRNLSELLNDPNFEPGKLLAAAQNNLSRSGQMIASASEEDSTFSIGDQTAEENTDSIDDITNRAALLDPASEDYSKQIGQLHIKLQHVNELQTTLAEVLNNLNTVKQMTARKLGE